MNVPWQDPEVVKELLWRRHIYNNALASIKAHFREETEKSLHGAGSRAQMIKDDEAELEALLKANDAENKRMAQIRAEREKREMTELEEETLAEVEAFLKAEAVDLSEKDRQVQEMIVSPTVFIYNMILYIVLCCCRRLPKIS